MRDESEECEAEESIWAGSWYFVIIRYEGKWPAAAEDCSQFLLGQTWGDTTEMNIKTQIQFPMSWIISNHLLGMSAGIETVGLVIVMVYQLILSLSRCFQSHLSSLQPWVIWRCLRSWCAPGNPSLAPSPSPLHQISFSASQSGSMTLSEINICLSESGSSPPPPPKHPPPHPRPSSPTLTRCCDLSWADHLSLGFTPALSVEKVRSVGTNSCSYVINSL